MAKRLEDQLTEARAAAEAKLAELCQLEAAKKKEIDATEAAYKAANVKSEALSEAAYALEQAVAAEQKLATFTKEGTRRWHPEFLKRIADEVGFHWSERQKIDPKNDSSGLYERALSVVFNATLEANSDIKAAKKVANDASNKAHDLYRAHSRAEDPVRHLRYAVLRLERDVQELLTRIADRDAEKRVAAEAPASSPHSKEFEEKAKAARAKLRAIIERHQKRGAR